MDVAQDYIQVLTQRDISIRVDNQFTENAMTPKFQPVILPFVIQGNKIEILVRLMYGRGYLADKLCIIGLQQTFGRVKE
jgi:hypothetical protein